MDNERFKEGNNCGARHWRRRQYNKSSHGDGEKGIRSDTRINVVNISYEAPWWYETVGEGEIEGCEETYYVQK